MDTKQVYSNKAEKYARYRWDYDQQAIDSIFAISGLGEDGCIADIGAGTGILTRHLVGRARTIYAVEPNFEMRSWLQTELAQCQACHVIDGSAEATGLPDHSVDLVTIAQAIHWFNPEEARKELRRILIPGGWLAVLRNISTQDEINQAASELHRAEYGFEGMQAAVRMNWKPLIYYYGNGRFQRIRFCFAFKQNFERFLGSLLSTAGMPDESHPRYHSLEQAARAIFDRFSIDGQMEVQGETELYIGQVSGIG